MKLLKSNNLTKGLDLLESTLWNYPTIRTVVICEPKQV